jgi:cytochrome b subunit of formate dehydrogenase
MLTTGVFMGGIGPLGAASALVTLGTVDRTWAAAHHSDWVATVEERERALSAPDDPPVRRA